MKILIPLTGPWGTGSFTVAKALQQAFIRNGHEVLLFFPDAKMSSEDLNEFYENKKLYHIWQFPISEGDTSLETFPLMIPDPHPRAEKKITFNQLSSEQLALYLQKAEEALLSVIKSFKPDIIDCQHIWFLGYLLAKNNIPYFCTAHHSDQMGFKYINHSRDLIKMTAQSAEKIIAISLFVKNEVITLYDLKEKNVCSIPSGYDNHCFKPMEVDKKAFFEKHSIPFHKDNVYISFPGKISTTKGFDILLEVAKALLPKNVHFLAVGSGDSHSFMAMHSQCNSIPQNVHLLGQISSKVLATIHNVCLFAFMPSRSEGFGLAGLEAMGCKIPLICSSTGGLSEYAIGYIIEDFETDSYLQAFEKALSLNPKDYETLCNDSYQRAQEYSWEKSAFLREELYKTLKKTV